MNVKILKLLTGEELIGDLDISALETHGIVRLVKPLLLFMHVDHETRTQRLLMTPYMQYSTAPEQVELTAASLLLAPLDPIDQLVDDYTEAVGGIVTPRKQIIRPAGM